MLEPPHFLSSLQRSIAGDDIRPAITQVRRFHGSAARWQQQFPDAAFAGYKFGDELAALLADADVMVFPSRTDTFGLVNLEAMACGVPVAAYPVTGPIDVIEDGVTGALDHDLKRAALRALHIDPKACRPARSNRDGTSPAASSKITWFRAAIGQRAVSGRVECPGAVTLIGSPVLGDGDTLRHGRAVRQCISISQTLLRPIRVTRPANQVRQSVQTCR
jgi:hypothetical protein